MEVRAMQYDTVDAICHRYYGRTEGMTEIVLIANPGLSDRGPYLPNGMLITLPDVVPNPIKPTVQLWD